MNHAHYNYKELEQQVIRRLAMFHSEALIPIIQESFHSST